MVKDMMVLSVGGRDPHHGALPASQVTCQGHRSAGAFGDISQFLVYLRLVCAHFLTHQAQFLCDGEGTHVLL